MQGFLYKEGCCISAYNCGSLVHPNEKALLSPRIMSRRGIFILPAVEAVLGNMSQGQLSTPPLSGPKARSDSSTSAGPSAGIMTDNY